MSQIHTTGGGAHKYTDMFESAVADKDVKVHKHDEMASLVNGMAFVLQNAKNPSYIL